MDLSILHIADMNTKEIEERNSVKNYVALRRIKNISAKHLAEELNVDPRIISAFEREYTRMDYEFNQKYRDGIEKILKGGSDEHIS